MLHPRQSLSFAALSLALLCGCGVPDGTQAEGEDPSSLPGAEGLATDSSSLSVSSGIRALTASANDGNLPSNAADGALGTRWSALGRGAWLLAELDAPRTVDAVTLAWHRGDQRASRFRLEVSTDGKSFTPVFAGSSSGKTVSAERYPFTPTTARFVRVVVDGNSENLWASITEMGVPPASGSPGDTGGGTTGPAPAPGRDAFGTRELYSTAPEGRTWAAKWDANPRTLRAGQRDPQDPEFQMRGSNHTLVIPGDGTAKSSGDTIRLYVGSAGRTWLNTELTVYARRVSEQSDADSATGFEFQTRTADGHTASGSQSNDAGLDVRCDGHSYGYSLRYDGRALFEKELKHPAYTPQVSRNIWNGGALPRNQWVGIKVVTYNLPDGGVKLELWRDLTDGADGGRWEKVHEYTDAGGWSVSPSVAASCGIPADFRITTPQPLVIIRNSNIAEQWYKKATLREIVPPAP